MAFATPSPTPLYTQETVDDAPVGDGEVRVGAVDVGREDLEPHRSRLADVGGHLVGVAHLVREVGGHELGGIVGLEVGGAIGDDGIRGGVGLVEAVAREGDQYLEDAIGVLGLEALLDRAREELLLLLHEDLELLLPHGPAEDVGLAQREAGDALGDLHDLLLVDDDPVGLLEDGLEAGIGVGDGSPPPLRLDELRDVGHGARAIERVERYQVLHAGGLGLLEDPLHARGLELKHARALALAQEGVGLLVVLGDSILLDRDAALADQLEGVLDEGEGLEAEEVHLHEAAFLEEVHRVLRRHDARLRVP